MMQSNYKEAWEFERQCLDFLETILSAPTHLAVVVLGHIHVENALESLIAANCVTPKALPRGMPHGQRIQICEALGCFDIL